ncbi:MAG: MOSC domain-containing protein [Planctomycetaceae bacterium]
MPHLARILIYPLKSFDPIEVSEATVLPDGALEHDRQFALFDSEGRVVNGKRTLAVHRLRTQFDLAAGTITLEAGAARRTFRLDADRAALEAWLSEHLGTPLTLRENRDGGFPDDGESPGPTVISTPTLVEVAGWFPGLTLDEVRLRFRANLEIDGVEPFWEDRLYGEEGDAVAFQIGSVSFLGTNPCQRCVVPTRSPFTGARTAEFTSLFEERRYEALPFWATRSRFDHFYRLATNTRPASRAGGVIRVGDEVRIAERG